MLHEELSALIEAALTFQLQGVHAGVLREQVTALMTDGAVARACRGISPRLDTLVGLLEDALEPAANYGTAD